MKALKYLHSAELLHRDIKPSNILLNADCHIKIWYGLTYSYLFPCIPILIHILIPHTLSDFGLCRSVADTSGPSPVLTDYIATRWYRAPGTVYGV